MASNSVDHPRFGPPVFTSLLDDLSASRGLTLLARGPVNTRD
jgi:hypothetical protein